MREVDEEVRKQQAVEFWTRWGKWVAIAVVVGLIAFGGWLYWSHQRTVSAERETEELSAILESINEGSVEGIDERLAALTDSSRPAVRAAALLTRADFALQSGEDEQAVEYFTAVAGDEDLPQQYRDLALIRRTAVEFGSLEPQEVIDRLAGFVEPGNPWFGSAGELTAIALIQQDKNDEAGELFARIANDEGVPETMRTRAVQMAGVLGVDAVPDEPVEAEAPAEESPAEEEANQ